MENTWAEVKWLNRKDKVKSNNPAYLVLNSHEEKALKVLRETTRPQDPNLNLCIQDCILIRPWQKIYSWRMSKQKMFGELKLRDDVLLKSIFLQNIKHYISFITGSIS